MKKRVLFTFLLGALIIAAMSLFISCDSKKEVKKVGAYELTEVNGKFGLKDSTGHVVLAPEYGEIIDKPGYQAVFAKSHGGLTTIVAGGYTPIVEAKIDSIVPTGTEKYAYVYCNQRGVYLWHFGASSAIGPFTDLRLIEDIVFLNTDGKWGAATLDHNGLAPRKFDRVIVVKTDKTMAVLVKDAKGWAMFDKDGVTDGKPYDTPAKVLEKQVKSLNVEGDVAVVKVGWKL
ncbi:MAG: hypothetical protein IJ770_02090 [Alphaproteobacteria bacterium]|nr:hypothetical protein [Alphaproteobacteria bacterium]